MLGLFGLFRRFFLKPQCDKITASDFSVSHSLNWLLHPPTQLRTPKILAVNNGRTVSTRDLARTPENLAIKRQENRTTAQEKPTRTTWEEFGRNSEGKSPTSRAEAVFSCSNRYNSNMSRKEMGRNIPRKSPILEEPRKKKQASHKNSRKTGNTERIGE